MRLAIIPARGGSKRIPDKNLRIFCGKPIIAYSIEAALRCGCFDRVIVSTDSDRIAALAQLYGAEVPFQRPEELSDDYTPTTPVIQHAIKEITRCGQQPSLVCCLYATAPFMLPSDIQRGLDLLLSANLSFTISMTGFGFPIQRALRITKQGRLSMFSPRYRNTRSQDLELAFHDAGQFYWGTSDAWTEARNPYSHESAPIIIPSWRVQDIDTPEDWQRAELMHQLLSQSGQLT